MTTETKTTATPALGANAWAERASQDAKEAKAKAKASPLPPGTILQHIYLRERLRLLKPGSFIEVGTGSGHISRVLLESGWTGKACDLSPVALEKAADYNRQFVDDGSLELVRDDWLQSDDSNPVDLIISSLVVEHLSEQLERKYFERCRRLLNKDGRAIVFVPGSPEHWNIEDEIAGHYRRYTHATLTDVLQTCGLRCQHIAGLTYPLSNMLLPLSNFLVSRAESNNCHLEKEERTKLSGHRAVPGKTTFSPALTMILNETMMQPLHRLQKLFTDHPGCLILYAEAAPH